MREKSHLPDNINQRYESENIPDNFDLSANNWSDCLFLQFRYPQRNLLDSRISPYRRSHILTEKNAGIPTKELNTFPAK